MEKSRLFLIVANKLDWFGIFQNPEINRFWSCDVVISLMPFLRVFMCKV